jgi:hypothetical protein
MPPLQSSSPELSRLSGDTTAVAAKADAYIGGLLKELDTVRAKVDASDINAELSGSISPSLPSSPGLNPMLPATNLLLFNTSVISLILKRKITNFT